MVNELHKCQRRPTTFSSAFRRLRKRKGLDSSKKQDKSKGE